MQTSRRLFLRQIAGVMSVTLGGTQLAGCLGGGDSGESTSQPAGVSQVAAPASSSAAAASGASPAPSAPSAPTQQPLNSGPVWQPAPTIEFVEGIPSVDSVRQFVQDPDQDPLVIQLQSGSLLPGITWNPNNATIGYDGRPLGAQPNQPVMVSGVTFTADDGKN